MIKLTGVARVLRVTPVQEIPTRSGQMFRKREIVLDDTWTGQDGVCHPNLVGIEFTGERMNLLDQFAPGQQVRFEAAVNGRESDGRVFVSLRGLTIAPAQPMQQQPMQQQPQPMQPQQQFGGQFGLGYGTPAYPDPNGFGGGYNAR